MPGGYKSRSWSRLSRGEIAGSLALFNGIGGTMIAACLRDVVASEFGVMSLLPAAGIPFVGGVVAVHNFQAFRELRCRRRG
jgi:tetrahydromethanopterin S-methyltransferase subunit D